MSLDLVTLALAKKYVDDSTVVNSNASLLVTVDVSTMTANYSKTEIINAAKSGKIVYADVMNQLFVLKNIANASFTSVTYMAGTKVDLTSFLIDDEKKVHINTSDIYNLLPSYSSSDYGKYATPSANGLMYKDLPSVDLTGYATENYVNDAIANIEFDDGYDWHNHMIWDYYEGRVANIPERGQIIDWEGVFQVPDPEYPEYSAIDNILGYTESIFDQGPSDMSSNILNKCKSIADSYLTIRDAGFFGTDVWFAYTSGIRIRLIQLIYNGNYNVLTINEYFREKGINQIQYDITNNAIIVESIDHSFKYAKKYIDNAIANIDIPKDSSLGITGATVGQIAQIAEVDAEGRPVEWEAADKDEKWELLCDVTLEEEVTQYEHSFKEKPMKKLLVILDTLAAEADTNYSGFTIDFNNEDNSSYAPYQVFYPYPMPRKSALRSIYKMSTYYLGNTPCLEVETHTADINPSANAQDNPKYWYVENLAERYFGKVMVPEIIKFNQNTYGKFAAGTRYRIYGVRA